MMYRSVPAACFLIILLTGVFLETSAQRRSELALRVFDHEGNPAAGVRVAAHSEPCTAGMKSMQVFSKTDAEGKLFTILPHRKPPCLWIRWKGREFLFPLFSDAAERSTQASVSDYSDTESEERSEPYHSEKVLASKTIQDLRGNSELTVEAYWKFTADKVEKHTSDGSVSGRLFGLVTNGDESSLERMTGAIVGIVGLNKNAAADAEGRFRLTGLPRERTLALTIDFAPSGVNDTLYVTVPRDSELDLGSTLYYYLPEQ